jgi:hypothetical protein
LDDEAALMEAAAELPDADLRHTLVEVVALMAICDGELIESEREFLVGLATVLECPLDLEKLELRAQEYQIDVEQGMAGRATDSARETVTTAGRRLKGLGGALRRKGKVTSQMNTGHLQRSLHDSLAVP